MQGDPTTGVCKEEEGGAHMPGIELKKLPDDSFVAVNTRLPPGNQGMSQADCNREAPSR